MRNLPILFTSALLLTSALLFAHPASAEGEEKTDITDEIKAQMDEILALMKSNQEALLKLSTGKDAKPKRVEVAVPPAGEQQGAGTDGEGLDGASKSEGTAKSGDDAKRGRAADGESAARKIEALLGSQQEGSKRIPSEIEKLLKMIPT